MTARLIVIGIAGDKRAAALDAALARAGVDACTRIPWRDVLNDPDRLATVGTPGDFLRIESPGSDTETWHALARLGGSTTVVRDGEWRPGRAWFTGLGIALATIARSARHLVLTHAPDDVLSMTDKLACHALLHAGGVPVPETFDAPRDVGSLRARIESAGLYAAYVKPRWGSSGAGVLAYRRQGRREQVITTARLVSDRLFNEKRLSTYTDRASIDRLFAAVVDDGAVVQRWIPKAGTSDGPFDLRVLVVHGRPAHTIARVGRGAITNLHLDAARLDPQTALAPFGPRTMSAVQQACVAAAACFPKHSAVGVDVMVDPRGRPFVLECNAWGDYLPKLMVNGFDSYDLQVRELFRDAARGDALR